MSSVRPRGRATVTRGRIAARRSVATFISGRQVGCEQDAWFPSRSRRRKSDLETCANGALVPKKNPCAQARVLGSRRFRDQLRQADGTYLLSALLVQVQTMLPPVAGGGVGVSVRVLLLIPSETPVAFMVATIAPLAPTAVLRHVVALDVRGGGETGGRVVGRPGAVVHVVLGDGSLGAIRQRHRLGHLRAGHVVLIRRDRDRGQDADDRNHDHQFDQRETLLDSLQMRLRLPKGGAFPPSGPARSCPGPNEGASLVYERQALGRYLFSARARARPHHRATGGRRSRRGERQGLALDSVRNAGRLHGRRDRAVRDDRRRQHVLALDVRVDAARPAVALSVGHSPLFM